MGAAGAAGSFRVRLGRAPAAPQGLEGTTAAPLSPHVRRDAPGWRIYYCTWAISDIQTSASESDSCSAGTQVCAVTGRAHRNSSETGRTFLLQQSVAVYRRRQHQHQQQYNRQHQ
jgi:hypothetical protein